MAENGDGDTTGCIVGAPKGVLAEDGALKAKEKLGIVVFGALVAGGEVTDD